MPPVVSFRRITEKSLVQMKSTAKRMVTQTTQVHHENWQNRFGNNALISNESGRPGTAPPLSAETIERKGHSDMLDDQTKLGGGDQNDPSYDVPLMDSLEWFIAEQNDGPAKYEVRGWSVIDNWVFPLNEFGLTNPVDGQPVPQRSTLLPTRIEISQHFSKALREAYRSTLTGRGVRRR